MKNRIFKPLTSLVLAILMVATLLPAMFIGAFAEETYTWTRVTSVETLKAGGKFIIGYEATANSGIIVPMANTGSATTSAAGFMYSGVAATSGDQTTLNMTTYAEAGEAFVVTIAESTVTAGNITIHTGTGYIGNANTKNNCKQFAADTVANGTSFTATVDTNDVFTLKNANTQYNTLQYNSSSPRFACYGGTQKNLVIYQRTVVEAPHEHSYSWDSNVGTDGSHTLTCANTDGKCDATSITEDCTWVDGKCSVCGAEAPECAHPTTTEVAEVPATCTEVGYTAGVQCTECNQYISGHEKIPAKGHTEEIDAAVDATCTEAGLTEGKHCSVCEELLVEQDEVPALGHNYVDGVCSECGEEQPTTLTINRDAFGTASGYAWHAWTATTTTGESITGSGFIYGTTSDSMQMNAKTNTNGNYIYNTAALPGNITSIKVTAFKTTYRGFVVLTSDTPFDSTTDNRLTSTEATVTVDNTGATWEFTTNHKYFAIVLVDEEGAAYLSSIEINYFVCPHTNCTAVEAKDATCTEAGYSAHNVCNDCGEVIGKTEIPATGHIDENPVDSKCDTCGANMCTEHVWIDGDVIAEGDCTTNRVVAQVCEKCGELGEDKVTIAPGHQSVIDAAVAPTCTESGLTEGSHCSVCEEVLVKQEEVPAAHTWNGTDCTECGATRTIYNKVDDPNTLKDGDGIVIYYPAGGLLISGTASGTKLTGVAGSVDGSILGCENGELLLIVRKDANGDFLFQTEDDLYLTSGATGNSLTLEATLTDYARWYFDTTGTTATLRIVNRNATYNGTTQALEYYNAFTVYGIKDTSLYHFEIYQKDGYSKPIAVPTNTQYSISLKGNIGVNIYYYIPEAWLAENEGAQLNINGTLYDLKAGENAYSYNVGPADLNTAITYFIVGDEDNKTTVTVNGYIEAATATYASDTALRALLETLKTYGEAADAYISNPSGEGATEVSDADIKSYIEGYSTSRGNNSINFDSISAVAESLITLQIHFDPATLGDTAYVYQLYYMNGEDKVALTGASGSMKDFASTGVINIYGVPAYALDMSFVLDVTGNGENMVTTSVMAYVNAALYGDNAVSSVTLRNLLIALAEYSNAASTYFGA